MGNPLRSEAAAFRLLLGAAAIGLAVALVGVLVNGYAALGVFLAVLAGLLLRRLRRGPGPTSLAPRGDGRVRLIVAAPPEVLSLRGRERIVAAAREREADEVRLLGIAGAAQTDVDLTLSALLTAGIRARGSVVTRSAEEVVALAAKLGPDAVLVFEAALHAQLAGRLGSILLELQGDEACEGGESPVEPPTGL